MSVLIHNKNICDPKLWEEAQEHIQMDQRGFLTGKFTVWKISKYGKRFQQEQPINFHKHLVQRDSLGFCFYFMICKNLNH